MQDKKSGLSSDWVIQICNVFNYRTRNWLGSLQRAVHETMRTVDQGNKLQMNTVHTDAAAAAWEVLFTKTL